jgi:hypothetical protein
VTKPEGACGVSAGAFFISPAQAVKPSMKVHKIFAAALLSGASLNASAWRPLVYPAAPIPISPAGPAQVSPAFPENARDMARKQHDAFVRNMEEDRKRFEAALPTPSSFVSAKNRKSAYRDQLDTMRDEMELRLAEMLRQAIEQRDMAEQRHAKMFQAVKERQSALKSNR